MSMTTVEENEAYWDQFYKQDFVHVPSQFCALVATDIKPHSIVVDLGCGNGRDSHFFASANFSVVGVDLSYGVIEACRAQSGSNKDLQFVCGDISDEGTCKEIKELLAREKGDKSISFYSRFVMHSLDEEQEELFMLSLKTSCG